MIPADLAEIIERTAWRWSYTQFCTSCRTTVQWKRRTNFKHGDHSGSPNVNSHVIYIIYTNSVLVYSDLSDAKATNEQRISICSGALALAGQLGAGVNVACSRLSDSCALSQWYGHPHSHIPSVLASPMGDAQNADRFDFAKLFQTLEKSGLSITNLRLNSVHAC